MLNSRRLYCPFCGKELEQNIACKIDILRSLCIDKQHFRYYKHNVRIARRCLSNLPDPSSAVGGTFPVHRESPVIGFVLINSVYWGHLPYRRALLYSCIPRLRYMLDAILQRHWLCPCSSAPIDSSRYSINVYPSVLQLTIWTSCHFSASQTSQIDFNSIKAFHN